LWDPMSPTDRERYFDGINEYLDSSPSELKLYIGGLLHHIILEEMREVVWRANASHSSRPSSPDEATATAQTEGRSWFVGRMLRVAKLLCLDSLIRLHEALFTFLDPRHPVPEWMVEGTGRRGGDNVGWIEELKRELEGIVRPYRSRRGAAIEELS